MAIFLCKYTGCDCKLNWQQYAEPTCGIADQGSSRKREAVSSRAAPDEDGIVWEPAFTAQKRHHTSLGGLTYVPDIPEGKRAAHTDCASSLHLPPSARPDLLYTSSCHASCHQTTCRKALQVTCWFAAHIKCATQPVCNKARESCYLGKLGATHFLQLLCPGMHLQVQCGT